MKQLPRFGDWSRLRLRGSVRSYLKNCMLAQVRGIAQR